MPRGHLSRREFLSTSGTGIAWAVFGTARLSLGQPSRRRFSVIYFTKFLRGLNPEEIARVVKGMGLDGLDLTVRRGHCVNPENVEEALPKAMEVWRKAGVSVPMVSTETNLTDPNHPTVKPIWAACSKAGIRNIKIGYWRWREGTRYGATMDGARRDLAGFRKLAERYKVRALVHTHSGPYLGCNASNLMSLLHNLDPACVAAYIDPAHLSINGEPLPLALEIIGDHLAMVAVKNVAYVPAERPDRTAWTRRWCLLREGVVDWPEAIALLRKRGYEGPLSLHGEYSGPEDREAILQNVSRDAKYLLSIVR